MILICINNYVYAGWDPLNGFTSDGTHHMDTDLEIGTTTAITSSVEMTEKMLGSVQLIGSIISVIALVIIGIRYMISSVEEQAKMKGVLIYYIVGAVLVFATSNVLSIVYQAISGI